MGTASSRVTERVEAIVAWRRSGSSGGRALHERRRRAQKQLEAAEWCEDYMEHVDWTKLEKCWDKVPRVCKSSYTNIYIQAAKRMGWQVRIVSRSQSKVVLQGPGARNAMIQLRKHKIGRLNSTKCAKLMRSKWATHKLLRRKKVPMIPTRIVSPDDEAAIKRSRLLDRAWTGPFVVKPCRGSQGKGVQLGLMNAEDVEDAILNVWGAASASGSGGGAPPGARARPTPCVVQQQVYGNDYRVLMLDRQILDVAWRLPACVVGNGRHTTARLVKMANATRKRCFMPLIKPCGTKGPFNDIPARRARRYVQDKANISLGGDAHKFPLGLVHPDNADLFRRLAGMFPAQRMLGIDFMGDMKKSYRGAEHPGFVLELNSSPQIFCHTVRGSRLDYTVVEAILRAAAIEPELGRAAAAGAAASLLDREIERLGMDEVADVESSSDDDGSGADSVGGGSSHAGPTELPSPAGSRDGTTPSDGARALVATFRGALAAPRGGTGSGVSGALARPPLAQGSSAAPGTPSASGPAPTAVDLPSVQRSLERLGAWQHSASSDRALGRASRPVTSFSRRDHRATAALPAARPGTNRRRDKPLPSGLVSGRDPGLFVQRSADIRARRAQSRREMGPNPSSAGAGAARPRSLSKGTSGRNRGSVTFDTPVRTFKRTSSARQLRSQSYMPQMKRTSSHSRLKVGALNGASGRRNSGLSTRLRGDPRGPPAQTTGRWGGP
jgi:glutathione synthase/RimK-type ligase-like ATP-grasp enzyme